MKALKILALGDSYTIGEGVDEKDSWPAQLIDLLADDGIPCEPPKIIAQTGWTTEALMTGVKQHALQMHYDLVTLLIGVNNQYRKQPISTYEPDFVTLLDLAIEYVGTDPQKVIVLSIPDWSVTPFARHGKDQNRRTEVASEIDDYNRINCRIAYKKRCNYVDVTALTREHQQDPHAWASDGLHPARLMYTQWARKLHPVVQTLAMKCLEVSGKI